MPDPQHPQNTGTNKDKEIGYKRVPLISADRLKAIADGVFAVAMMLLIAVRYYDDTFAWIIIIFLLFVTLIAFFIPLISVIICGILVLAILILTALGKSDHAFIVPVSSRETKN